MHDFQTQVLTISGTTIFFVGQAGFIIKSRSGQLLAIDLYLSNCVERIEGNKGFKRLLPQILNPGDLNFDAVICTHAHMDHFDIDAVPEMISRGAKLFCSTGCSGLIHQLHMDYYSEKITYVEPGDRIECGDFSICFVSCDHGVAAPDAVGVVVKVDGKNIYEAGDTCLRLDLVKEIQQPLDVLIAPINGMYGNMNSMDMITFAEILKPSVIIPCHYGMFASHGGNLKEFYDTAIERKLPIMLMQQGESFSL